MNLYRVIHIFLILITFPWSFASAGYSEFVYQPEAEENLLSPLLIYQFESYQDFSANSKTEFYKRSLMLDYIHGLNEYISAGATLTYSNSVLDSNKGASGLEDLQMRFKARIPVNKWTYRLGFDVQYSPEESKYDNDGLQRNLFSGSRRLTPYLGIDREIGKQLMGVVFARQVSLGNQRTMDGSSRISESSGGEYSRFDFYHEFGTDMWRLISSLSYYFFDKAKSLSSSQESRTPQFLYAQLIFSYYWNERLFFYPIIGYESNLFDKRNESFSEAIYLTLGMSYLF